MKTHTHIVPKRIPRRAFTLSPRWSSLLSASRYRMHVALQSATLFTLLALFTLNGCGRTELQCDSHADCASGEACVQSLCIEGASCVEGLCPTTQQCVADICIDRERLPEECDDETACPDGLSCVEGRCLATCEGEGCVTPPPESGHGY